MIRERQENLEIIIDLDGPEGNGFCLLGTARNLSRRLRMTKEQQEQIQEEMTSSDYKNLVETFDHYFGDYVTLETTNESLLS